MQNKLLWAVSGKTAAELVYYRANAALPQMGLTSTEKQGKVMKSDIEIGKNYLTEEEVGLLKLIVEQYLAFAEAQAMAHVPMYMADWVERLRMVLTMNQRSILEDAGRISHELAKQKANEEYRKYQMALREEEHRYGLTYGFRPSESDAMFERVEELLAMGTAELKREWAKRRGVLLREKIDYTAFMVWFIENYSLSVELTKNADEKFWQRFK